VADNRLSRRAVCVGASGLALKSLFSPPAFAQGLSSRPINLVVPYTAGSAPDVLARLFAEHLRQRWNQPVVVDNRVGASGNIGTQAVARAEPDGHTLLLTANTIVMNVSLFVSVPYDPVTSFAPIAHLVTATFGLVVHRSIPASNPQDFIAEAKRRPGQINYGSPGVGTPHHLAMELLKQSAKIDIVHVPYRGLGPATTDLMGGHIAAMFLPVQTGLELSRENNVRVLAVTGAKRVEIAPDIPTFGESGLPDLDIDNWWGLLAPRGTPAEIVNRYNDAANDFLRSPDMAAKLAAQGLTPAGSSPERLQDLIARDLPRWAKVVKEAGITPQ
jgi:tripartite-type tricarboxylate transporter receptor subunit TctC